MSDLQLQLPRWNWNIDVEWEKLDNLWNGEESGQDELEKLFTILMDRTGPSACPLRVCPLHFSSSLVSSIMNHLGVRENAPEYMILPRLAAEVALETSANIEEGLPGTSGAYSWDAASDARMFYEEYGEAALLECKTGLKEKSVSQSLTWLEAALERLSLATGTHLYRNIHYDEEEQIGKISIYYEDGEGGETMRYLLVDVLEVSDLRAPPFIENERQEDCGMNAEFQNEEQGGEEHTNWANTGFAHFLRCGNQHFSIDSSRHQRPYYCVLTDGVAIRFALMHARGSFGVTKPAQLDGDRADPLCTLFYIVERSKVELMDYLDLKPLISHLPMEGGETSEFPVATIFFDQRSGQRFLLTLLSTLGSSIGSVVYSCKFGWPHNTTPSPPTGLSEKPPPTASTSTFVIKIGTLTSPTSEENHLEQLRECHCVSNLVASGGVLFKGSVLGALVFDTMGVSLLDMFTDRECLTLDTARVLWKAMRRCIRQIHEFGVLHGDLKPNHFILNSSGMWLIDFDSSPSRVHLPRHPEVQFRPVYKFTEQFASRAVLAWEHPTFNDDYISAAYSLIFLLRKKDELNNELPIGHQENPTALLQTVRDEMQDFARSLLREVRVIP